jgi:hypothetical protein
VFGFDLGQYVYFKTPYILYIHSTIDIHTQDMYKVVHNRFIRRDNPWFCRRDIHRGTCSNQPSRRHCLQCRIQASRRHRLQRLNQVSPVVILASVPYRLSL